MKVFFNASLTGKKKYRAHYQAISEAIQKADHNIFAAPVLKNNPEKAKTLFAITQRISENGFVYETEDKKLSKWNKKRDFKVSIIYRIDQNGENAHIKLANKSGIKILEEHLLKNRVYDFHNNLYKTKWNENKFQIFNRDGKLYKEFDFEKNCLQQR